MKIYTVHYFFDESGRETKPIIAFFSTQEKAQAFLDKEHGEDVMSIQEHEVDTR